MTWQITNWPNSQNSWAARVGCFQCNPYTGDHDCFDSLPVLCVIDAYTLDRPYYKLFPDPTPSFVDYIDQSFYNGWIGGYLAATDPISGTNLKSQANADLISQQKFGPNAKIVEHSMGKYMAYMNDPPAKIGSSWVWAQTLTSGWGVWGYIQSSLPAGKMWTWIIGQDANCV
jgi:hypothetical protein